MGIEPRPSRDWHSHQGSEGAECDGNDLQLDSEAFTDNDTLVDPYLPDFVSGGGNDRKKKMPISTSQKFTLGYAALLGVGGVMGYLKGGGPKSLLAGGLSASLMYYVYTELPQRPAFASSVGLGVSGVLCSATGVLYKRTGKFFPAGVVSLVSLVMVDRYLHGIRRTMN